MEATFGVASRLDAELCVRKVLRIEQRGEKTACDFADGSFVLLSNFLGSFIHAGDELHFPVQADLSDAATEIHVRVPEGERFRRDILHIQVGYVTQTRKDRRGNLYVSAEALSTRLGITAVQMRCETLRDYFYVGNRRQPWDKQPSLYELLRVTPSASPTELRIGFRMRALELRAACARGPHIAAVERAFNILARPELRTCYDALLDESTALVVFPNGGFGSLLVAGLLSRDGATFYAAQILGFLPEQRRHRFSAPFRHFVFYDQHVVYRDCRRKLEVMFDHASLPLPWDSTWNQWKHLLGARVRVQSVLVQSGKYCNRAGSWQLAKWETALPSRLETTLPGNIAEQIAQAQQTHHRFGQFAEGLEQIRKQVESAPMEKTELQQLCSGLDIPGDFDVALITWKPDYDAFYYKQLSKRARRLYLYSAEYIFDLERAVIVETPQLGHATYVFSKPTSMAAFLALYSRITKEDIRHNRDNAAEKLGFLGRLIHGASPRSWLKELKSRLGEVVDYAEASDS